MKSKVNILKAARGGKVFLEPLLDNFGTISGSGAHKGGGARGHEPLP